MLDLCRCYIQDHGFLILHRRLLHCYEITITELWLNYNGLTTLSSSLVSDITVKCQVKVLVIDSNNMIGENDQLYYMLTDSSTMLEELHMADTKLSRGALNLFNGIKHNNKLKGLYINRNSITDDVCDVITAALELNSCLVLLHLYNNPLTGEAIVNMVANLKVNNTLEVLGLPNCPEHIRKRIICLQEVINKRRESQGCQVMLMISFY